MNKDETPTQVGPSYVVMLEAYNKNINKVTVNV